MQTPSREFQELFSEKARAVSAVVEPVKDMTAAFGYAVALCKRRQKEKDADAPPTIAAPALSADDRAILAGLCREAGIQLLQDSLRGNLQGIDVGCTYADFGIAETGTLVINSTDEDLRLATMISDIHLAILPASRIRSDDQAIAPELRNLFADPANFTAFITGPSRTADIERVLAIGVHGPLELHILLLEDTPC